MNSQTSISDVDSQVLSLVNHIWHEAQGNLESFLSVPVQSIKLADVDNAESVLLSIKQLIQRGNASRDALDLASLADEFYKLIPHKLGEDIRPTMTSLNVVARKLDLCQVSKQNRVYLGEI